MPKTWQLQEAKNRLSKVVDQAIEHGPQTITRYGVATVVVVSVKDFDRLKKRREGLVEFFRRSPLSGAHLDLSRNPDSGRTVEL